MPDRPQTPDEKAVRMYNKPAWLSKWLIRRSRDEESHGRPKTPEEKGQRSHKGPARLTKWLLRRNRYEEDGKDS